jgi:acyl dehydratase
MMTLRYFEDFAAGEVISLPGRQVTRAEIIAFATEYDPQPFHLDEDAARDSLLGGLAASGWHSCCLLMRMISDGLLAETRFMGAPGIEEVRWLAPLRPGDTISVRATVLEIRASRSRPELGFVKFLFEMCNARGDVLTALTVSPMFERRDSDNVDLSERASRGDAP